MKRAGADGILTYFAKRAAGELKTGEPRISCKREGTHFDCVERYNP